jgi:hypothetical protein
MKLLRLTALIFIITAFTFPAKEVKLEYAFKIGDQYTWSQTSHQIVKQTIPGMGDISVTVDVSGTMNLKVAELTANGAKIEIQYQNLKMTTKSPMGMGDIAMDSEGDETSAQNKTIKAMMNKPFYFKLTKQGVIESVEGTENLYSDFDKLGLDEASLKATKQQFEQTMGEKSLKASLEMALASYPDKKVKTNDTWKSTGSLAMNFPVKIDNTWSLKTLEGSMATLNADGILSTTDKEKVVALPNGMNSKFDLAGKQTIKTTVMTKSGWPADLKVTSEVKGNMTLLAGGMIPQDMIVPMVITTESDYKIVKK